MKKTKKLRLAKETIRALSEVDLKQADGGASFVFCTVIVYLSGLNSCSVVGCTRFSVCEVCQA
jgi:hypothetical protein